MRNATRFVFSQYVVDPSRTHFSFSYRVEFDTGEPEEFEEELSLFSDNAPKSVVDTNLIDRIARNLHLILGISYYKLWCPKEIVIEQNFLSEKDALFWNTVYTKGLGEFFYKNQIDYRDLIKFPYTNEAKPTLDADTIHNEKKHALVGIGGGKDSLLAAEMVRQAGVPFSTWDFGSSVQQNATRAVGEASITVKRSVDPHMIELSKTSEVYAGHVPVSAMYAFISLLVGVVYGFDYLVFGNERSANYGNVEYLGTEINHQWSKSKEYEDLFRAYVRENITSGVEYFSLLRPLYEIEIVRRFCELKKYFSVFSSCNRNFTIQNPQKDRLWCGECEKCAFVFCLTSAFVSKNTLISIFGENLYAKENLADTYRELLGIKDIKPFECVGTPDEVKVAMHMAREKGEYAGDIVMQLFELEVMPHIDDIEPLKKEVFSYGDDSNIPKEFKQALTSL